VIIYDTRESGGETITHEARVYFESIGDISKVLAGVHLRTEIQLVQSLNLFFSGQYYFNSIYSQATTDPQTLKESKAFVLQAGLSFAVWHFGK
jgi:hypothetical protein